MTASDTCRAFAEEMIWMAWFLTGSESASDAILRNVTCEGLPESSALSLTHKARLVVVRAFYRVFGESNGNATHGSGDTAASGDHKEDEKNPLLVLPPAERSVYVLRLVMGQGEHDAAMHLGLPQNAIPKILAKAAARLATVFSPHATRNV